MYLKLNIGGLNRNKQFECLMFLYFVVLFAHQQIPYLKFILWIIVISYLALSLLIGKITIQAKENLKTGLFWIGAFFIWINISYSWITFRDVIEESTTRSAYVRIVPVILGLVLYCNTKEKCISMFKVYTFSVTYTVVVALITSPMHTFGTTDFGGIVSLHRNNIGAIATIAAFSLFYYGVIKKLTKYCVFACIPVLVALSTGSRGALLSLAFMFFVYAMLEKNIKKRTRNLLLIGIMLIVAIYAVVNIPFLNQFYGERLLAIFSDKYYDQSFEDRNYYVVVGLEMISEKPWFGWGPDNFGMFLEKNGEYGRAVYSHNNYIELLANYGIIGFALYYWIYVKILRISFKYRNDPFGKFLFILILRYILCDFSGISYLEYDLLYPLAVVLAGVVILEKQEKKL